VKYTIIIAAMAIAGCAASSTPSPSPPKSAARPARPAAPREREMKADREAQLAWCSYLKALYLRAEEGATEWPSFKECTEVKGTAAPALLEQTASCSMRALTAFKGDPFSVAYAEQVGHCGTAAIEAMAVSRVEIEPFIDDLCRRAATCGVLDAVACRASFDDSLEGALERAVGAMNRNGRDQLRMPHPVGQRLGEQAPLLGPALGLVQQRG